MAEEKTESPEWRRRQDLASFLRAKRAAFSPKDVGLPSLGRRRAPGLRREELAQIAGIGVTWYTWLEQGREISVSVDLLQRLTEVLKLSPHDSAYLYSLAGHPAFLAPQKDQSLIEGLQTVFDDYVGGPAAMMDGIGTVVAYNRIADVLYLFTGYDGPWGNNLFWRMFMDASFRNKFLNWYQLASYYVGLMRSLYASQKRDTGIESMIDDLRGKCPEFRQMWDESAPQGASPVAPSLIHLQVDGLGELRFLSVRLLIQTREGWASFQSPLDEATAVGIRRFIEVSV